MSAICVAAPEAILKQTPVSDDIVGNATENSKSVISVKTTVGHTREPRLSTELVIIFVCLAAEPTGCY